MKVSKTKSTISKNQINWNHLFYFSEVATYGSIKEASEVLSVSPSTLSEQIAQLERDLKIQLFDRSHRKLTLTPEGAKLFLHTKEMFESGQRLIDVVSPVPVGDRPVSVGIVPTFSLPVAYSLISKYLKSHNVNMKLYHSSHEELEKNLAEARYDFGVSDLPPERKDIAFHLLNTSDLNFYVNEKFAGRKLSQLMKELPLLICNADVGTRSILERRLSEAGIAPSTVVTSDYPWLLMKLCRNGQGIGVFSEDAVAELAQNNLKPLRISKDAPKLMDKLYLLWAKSSETSQVIKQLKEMF